jgi:hypothetical protein
MFFQARWRGACGMGEWLCNQERLNPEVTIIFGTAARYRRATVYSSHDDSHPGNLTLNTWGGPSPMIEWLCTRERWNLEVTTTLGTAARYRRVAVGSSGDAHPGSLSLHTEAVRP